jgi:hypothetical protein
MVDLLLIQIRRRIGMGLGMVIALRVRFGFV